MLENEKIEEEIKNNPEILKNFNRDHADLLTELRGRFQVFIANGDVVGRYPMTKALFETIQIQSEVSKQHIQERIAEHGVFVVHKGGTAC